MSVCVWGGGVCGVHACVCVCGVCVHACMCVTAKTYILFMHNDIGVRMRQWRVMD